MFAGDVYVRCQLDCGRQLAFDGFDLPSDSEDPGYGFARSVEGVEHSVGGGVGALEGSAADEELFSKTTESEPPPGWLFTLWEGGFDAGETR